jgi:hypothetical protein
MNAHALLVGHGPEFADVADAVVALHVQLRDAVLEVGRDPGFIEPVIFGEARRERGPHAFQDRLCVFLRFMLFVFHGAPPSAGWFVETGLLSAA